MRTSIVIAAALAIGAAVWIGSGQFETEKTTAAPNGASGRDAAAVAEKGPPPVAVRVRTVAAEPHERFVVINGRTEESRRVTLRAETAGPISELAVDEGAPVVPDQVIAKQTPEDRRALLREAEALVEQRQIEYRAAVELSKKGFRSDTKLAEARAQLDAAKARAESMRINLTRTEIRAPFKGVLESRAVERGDYVKAGDTVAVIVDLDPLLAVGFVSERDVGLVRADAQGTVRLVDGTARAGKVRFVATVADPETRAFRVELEIPNPDNAIRAGLTGELRLPLPPASAFKISAAVLTLADDGRVGVRVVDPADRVAFVPVRILTDSGDGLWVQGLRDGDRLITVGHEYVKAGQKVKPVPETAETGS